VQSTTTPDSSPVAKWRIFIRTPLLILWTLFCVALFFIARLFQYKNWLKIPMLYHRGACRILSINVTISGKLSTKKPTLFVSSHVSYLDIIVMGGHVPGYFIAKSEVANWPVLGPMSKLQNTLFIERRGKHAKGQVQQMQDHLKQGGNLILFPEGTSTDGEHVEPFKSSLFHAAELDDPEVTIQPITVAYKTYRHQPMTRFLRDHYAWYADMPFGAHFVNVLGLANAQVELILHPTVKIADFESRKACARHCETVVSEGLLRVLPPLADNLQEPQDDDPNVSEPST